MILQEVTEGAFTCDPHTSLGYLEACFPHSPSFHALVLCNVIATTCFLAIQLTRLSPSVFTCLSSLPTVEKRGHIICTWGLILSRPLGAREGFQDEHSVVGRTSFILGQRIAGQGSICCASGIEPKSIAPVGCLGVMDCH